MRKELTGFAAILCLIVLFTMPASAAPVYTPGVEGVECGSLPPVGFHYRAYYVMIDADELKDDNGDEVPIGFEQDATAFVQRFVYISKKKLFGADYGVQLTVPFLDISIDTDFSSNDDSGIGDIAIAPLLLGWHEKKYDLSVAFEFFMPTGEFDEDEELNIGSGHWSGMLTLGGTYFFDDNRSLSASILTRTVYNFKNPYTDERKGMEFTAEWGIGKTIPVSKSLLITPGLCGYGQWDIADHQGTAANDERYRQYAAGAEVRFFMLPPLLLQGTVRYEKEFDARNAPEGHRVVFRITKSF